MIILSICFDLMYFIHHQFLSLFSFLIIFSDFNTYKQYFLLIWRRNNHVFTYCVSCIYGDGYIQKCRYKRKRVFIWWYCYYLAFSSIVSNQHLLIHVMYCIVTHNHVSSLMLLITAMYVFFLDYECRFENHPLIINLALLIIQIIYLHPVNSRWLLISRKYLSVI